MGWHCDSIDFETYRGLTARERLQVILEINRKIKDSTPEELPTRPKDWRR